MKLMVTGIGGVGGYVASVLCAAYSDVTLIARGPRKEALLKKGLVLHSDVFGEHTAFPAVTDDPSTAGIQDMIFVCVKNYSLADALTAILPCVGRHTVVVLILNGVDHGADQRVVDRVPDLHEQQQTGHCQLVDTHELGPEDRQITFEGKAHVAAEVTGGIAEFVQPAKLAVACCVERFCFRHYTKAP